jgi:hypothetical protein
MIQCVDHAPAQPIGVRNLAEGNCKLLRALDTGVVSNSTGCDYENVIAKGLVVVFEGHRPLVEVDTEDGALPKVDLLGEQLRVFGSYMPSLNFAAEVFVKHRREKEMVFVTDESDVALAGKFQCSEQTPDPAAYDDNPGFWRHSSP